MSLLTTEALWQLPDRVDLEATRLGVVGDPVEHSLSPQMHNAALEHLRLPFRYARIHVRPDELPDAFRAMRSAEFIGWNLTIPHKIAAVSLVDEIDPMAASLGAINTVVARAERLYGFNTDGPGLVAAIRELFGSEPRDLAIAIIGAGGAGQTAARYLAATGVRRLVVANRTSARVERLIETLPGQVTPVPWNALGAALGDVDLIINATSLGLDGTLEDWNPDWIQPRHRILDLVYRKDETPLVRAAKERGAPAADGLAMLLHQGVLAFELWFGKPAPVEQMRQALYQAAGRTIGREEGGR
jgi:shikimate dehydrogenase